MEKSRVQFNTHLKSSQFKAESEHGASAIYTGVGMVHAVVGAVILLIRSNPLNPLGFLR